MYGEFVSFCANLSTCAFVLLLLLLCVHARVKTAAAMLCTSTAHTYVHRYAQS